MEDIAPSRHMLKYPFTLLCSHSLCLSHSILFPMQNKLAVTLAIAW